MLPSFPELIAQILSLNNVDVTFASKSQVTQLVRGQEEIQFELRYDPQGYASYDAAKSCAEWAS